MGKVDSSTRRRLILAKKLYTHGCKHASNKDEVSRMIAIHNFDNAIELILKCIATKYGVTSSPKQEYRFKDLWNEIARKSTALPLKDQMFGLHDLRNTIQHQGDIPSQESIIKYQGYSEDFFRKVLESIFDTSYDELYPSILIENGKLRSEILKAEKAFEKKKYKGCIELCDGALITAAFDVMDIVSKAGVLTRYWGGGDELKNLINEDYIKKEYKGTNCYKLAKEVGKALLQVGQASTSMQFLDEYRTDFLKHREIISNLPNLSKNKLKESARFSLNFVTSFILKWQERG